MSIPLHTHPRLVLLGLYLLFLLLAEAVLRIGWGDELLPSPSLYVIPDPKVHHDYRPNTAFTTAPYPGDTFAPVHNQINAFGIRGPAPSPKRHPRVLLLGDSFVQADEVAYEKSFTHLLNAHFAGQLDFVSHGMVSWSPTPQFSWLHHKGLRLAPDAVVLFLCINDFYRPQTFHQTDAVYRGQARYRDRVPTAYALPQPSWRQKLFDRIALAGLLRRAYRTLRPRLAPPAASAYTIPNEITHLAKPAAQWPADLRANVDSTLQVVRDIHAYLRAKGIPLHTTLVPSPFAWPDEVRIGKQHPLYGWDADFAVQQRGLADRVREAMAAYEIPFIDLHTPFANAKARNDRLLFNEVDGHWKQAGHAIVFKALRDYFQARDLAPSLGDSVIR